MNKADLIEALAPTVGGRTAATQAVEGLVDLILREVAAGGSVVVTGFGTFERIDRAARTGRNPRTGEAVPIGATSSPRFRPAAYFKDVVNDPDRLPKEGLAGVRVASDGSAPQREGAPSSVRRSATGRGAPHSRASSSASSAPAAPPSAHPRRSASTGTPSTVRAARAPQAPVEEAPPVAPARGLVSGGEAITRTMIDAKKAQLARAKNEASGKKDSKRDSKQIVQKDSRKNVKKAGKKDPKKGRKGKKG